jgi:hypothetical protein
LQLYHTQGKGRTLKQELLDRWRYARVAATIFALALLAPNTAYAQIYDYDSAVAPEAAKAPLIRELFRTRPLTLRYAAHSLADLSTSDDAIYRDQGAIPYSFQIKESPLPPELQAVFDAVVMPGRATGESPEAWCEGFLADFASQSGVVHIEPAARSTSYADVVFQPWRQHCPTTAFNRWSWHVLTSASLIEDWKLPALLPDGLSYPEYSYAARNFRLYEVDLDNDPGNGTETVFYGEGLYDHWEAVAKLKLSVETPPSYRDWNDILPPENVPGKMLTSLALFNLIDMQECEAHELSTAPLSKRRAFYPAGETYNGIIRYKGSLYVYRLADVRIDNRWIYYLTVSSSFRYGGKRYTVGGVCRAEAPE